MTTTATALVPARAAGDPRLSRMALRILLYLGNQVDNGGFVRLSVRHFMNVLGIKEELQELAPTLSTRDARHILETRMREIEISLYQLFQYQYVEKKPRLNVEKYTPGKKIRYEWQVRSLL